MKKSPYWIIAVLPILTMLWVWLSPLSFVPVPWPDDSAFYFVAKHLFAWPPRWVMLAQAPFEPTYRIFNFNTMPLYPILIGLGRFIGIDGSHALKLWPLSAWALSGSLLGIVLYRRGLPAALAGLIALGFGLDPVLRWASVLIRPESLIGLAGMAMVLGLSFGFPKKFERRGVWDPMAALLVIAAYAHFNAVHLLFPAIAAILLNTSMKPRALIRECWEVGWRGCLYLVPWFLMILSHPALFVHQMTTQWKRLAVGNSWLNSVPDALGGIFQSMGSPEPWPKIVLVASVGIWVLILLAVAFLLEAFVRTVRAALLASDARPTNPDHPAAPKPAELSPVQALTPSAAWVLGSCWLWENKPEVWFTYYIHAAVWAFGGTLLLCAWKLPARKWLATPIAILLLGLTGIFGYVGVAQARKLSQSYSWRWDTYHSFIDCIDHRLMQLEAQLGHPKPFRVWDPTFPDVTIELSRRHPDWELTRTNDFWERSNLAIQHGHEVEAVVVPENYDQQERWLEGPASEHPELRSVWMHWDQYFLHHLMDDPNWKTNRYVCQRGRWQAYLFMK